MSRDTKKTAKFVPKPARNPKQSQQMTRAAARPQPQPSRRSGHR